jgi:hypothetical protein
MSRIGRRLVEGVLMFNSLYSLLALSIMMELLYF